MIVVIYPNSNIVIDNKKASSKKARLRQLMNRFDTLRSGYNYQLNEIRDEYYPKMKELLTEIDKISR